VENGFKKTTDFHASMSPEELEKQKVKDAERWDWGLSLIPRFVLSDGKPVAG
jgi:hypothetical protein